MRVIIVFALILSYAACGVPRNVNRIVGGEETTIENYPFMAAMLLNLWEPACGGTLVTSTAIVSAAHCYMNSPPTIWKVRLGSALSLSGGTQHTVSKIILHANYTREMLLNDIAVIKLTNPTVFSDKINIARIAGPNYILPDNTVVYAAGWGTIKWLEETSEVLRHVAVNVINQQICSERYAILKTVPGNEHMPLVNPEMICTGILNVGGKDACHGDSGGPVIHNRDVLVGITSWGHRCASRFFPGVSVRVSSYADWIFTNALVE